jgi:hypothetical protein
MKRQLKSSNTDHTHHNQDKVDRPNLDPIRDDPEPMIAPVKEPPRKKAIQMGEGSYEGTQKYAEGISNYLEHADVEADAKAAAPANKDEAASMEKAEREAASHSRENIKPKLHSEKKRDVKR